MGGGGSLQALQLGRELIQEPDTFFLTQSFQIYFSLKEVLLCFDCLPPGFSMGLQFKMFELCKALGFHSPCEGVVTGDGINLVMWKC